jgi:membrane protein
LENAGLENAFLQRHMPYGLSLKDFSKRFSADLKNEIKNDNVSNGAAALAYYWMLAIFPAMIALLSLLPYLPIPNLQQSVMDLLGQLLPGDASKMFTGTVQEVVSHRKGGLLSVGLLVTIWAASNGMYAIMQQLNITYDVKEGRSFFKVRGTAVILTFLVGLLMVGGLSLVVFGGVIQQYIGSVIGQGSALTTLFAVLRWVIIALAMTMAFAVTYYFGPDVEQKFKFLSPGSVAGVIALILASLGFRLYADHFGKFGATYGSIGAVVVLMLWLNITGYVILLGSEVNALTEHYNPEGKNKGEKKETPSIPQSPPRAA